MKGVTRSEFNKLMAIPEAKAIYEAKVLQLKCLFNDKLQEQELPETVEFEPDLSNIIPFPVQGTDGKKQSRQKKKNTESGQEDIIKIVDASRYRNEDEGEQARIFMDYFENHPTIRRVVLDEFFLRILPYSNINCIL